MKYLSSKPFTGGANSKAFVDRWDETFGKKSISPKAEDSPGSDKGNPPGAEVEQLKACNAKLLDALYMLRHAMEEIFKLARMLDRRDR